MGMPQLRSYRSRRESTGSLSGMRTSAGLFRDPCGELLNLGINRGSRCLLWECETQEVVLDLVCD